LPLSGLPSPLSHVFPNYVRPETLATANAPLVARQAGLPLAQAWGRRHGRRLDGGPLPEIVVTDTG